MKRLLFISGIILLSAGCNSTQPIQMPVPQTKTDPQTSYTMAQIQAANSAQKCWTVVSGNVYDLTSFISLHPGGDKNILKICGKDGTSAFQKQHGGDTKPWEVLKGLQIGVLK